MRVLKTYQAVFLVSMWMLLSCTGSSVTSKQPKEDIKNDSFEHMWPAHKHLVIKIRTDVPTGDVLIATGVGKFDYAVDWDNDGVFDEQGLSGSTFHQYGRPGTYTIRLAGKIPHLTFCRQHKSDGSDVLYETFERTLVDVVQWGAIQWESMEGTFADCYDLETWTAHDTPDISGVQSMKFTFMNANKFNHPIGDWNTSNVTTMVATFSLAFSFNQPLNTWDVSRVENMTNMFAFTNSFNQPLDAWDTSRVTSMYRLFFSSEIFNQPLDTWNTSRVTDMQHMFFGAASFNQPLDTWDTSNVTTMKSMFAGALSFEQSLGQWDISNVNTMDDMFDHTGIYSTGHYDRTLLGWSSQQSLPKNIKLGAHGASYCAGETARNELINTHGWEITGDKKECFKSSSTSTPHSLTSEIPSQDHFVIVVHSTDQEGKVMINTGEGEFDYAVDWDNDGVFDVHGLTRDSVHKFGAPGTYTIRLAGKIPHLFMCSEEHSKLPNQQLTDIIQWGDIPWRSMRGMFRWCNTLERWTALDSPDLSNVTDMSYTFASTDNFNQPLDTWDVSHVTTMKFMFSVAKNFNQPLDTWNVHNVASMTNMFYGALNFDQSLGTWNISKVTDMSRMLSVSAMGQVNYDSTLEGWSKLENVPQDITLGAYHQRYCTSEKARQTLIDMHGWVIDDEGKNCP